MWVEQELVVKQTKALGRDAFAIEGPDGELLGTARQTLKMSDLVKASRGVEVFDADGTHVLSIEDPVNFIRDTYVVHLASPPMQLAKLTKRFAWIGAKYDVEMAGLPDVQIQGQAFQLNYSLTSQGREIARVDAEYSGMGRLMMGKTSYRVRIEPGLDERQRAAVVGITLAIDMRRQKMRKNSG
mgnify:FL=1